MKLLQVIRIGLEYKLIRILLNERLQISNEFFILSTPRQELVNLVNSLLDYIFIEVTKHLFTRES